MRMSGSKDSCCIHCSTIAVAFHNILAAWSIAEGRALPFHFDLDSFLPFYTGPSAGEGIGEIRAGLSLSGVGAGVRRRIPPELNRSSPDSLSGLRSCISTALLCLSHDCGLPNASHSFCGGGVFFFRRTAAHAKYTIISTNMISATASSISNGRL